MTLARIAAALRRAGNATSPGVAARIVATLRVPQLRQPPLIEQAMTTETLALLTVLNAACDAVE